MNFKAPVFFALAFALAAFNVSADSQPALRMDKSSIDFGTVISPGHAKQTLKVKNAGAGSLNVSIRPSCECLSAEPSQDVLLPGKYCEFKLDFDSSQYNGDFKQYFFLDTNDPDNLHVTIVAQAQITQSIPEISVFGSPGCRFCHRLVGEVIPGLAKKNNVRLDATNYPLDQQANYEKLVEMEKKYNHPNSKIPVVFIGEKVFAGEKEISQNLEAEIEKMIRHHAAAETANAPVVTGGVMPTGGNVQQAIIEKFKSFRLLTIISAGLIDGINPCAMATIVFLLSYLALVGRSRSELLFTGIAYTFSVFLTYTLVGVGAFEIINMVNTYQLISKIIRYFTAGFAFVVGILSLRDYYLVKTGKKEEMSLQLPGFLKNRIHLEVRDRVRSRTIFISALILGFFVSLFELACTGQVYLPTIIYIIKNTHLKITGFGFLVLYNIMFIIPLVVVFVFAYRGVTSEQFARWVSKHLGAVKIATAILFFILAGAIFLS